MTSAEKIKELEAQVDGLVLNVKETAEQRAEKERRLQEQENANQDNYRDRSGTNRSPDNRPTHRLILGRTMLSGGKQSARNSSV